jgi:Zn-dependent oligopeptidase
MDYHTGAVDDTTKVWARVAKDIALIPLSEGTHPEASFGHILEGYDAGYYGYLWSKAYAQDMFTRFQGAGLLDAATGKRYREVILETGGGRDPLELVKEFLGREPNEEALLKSLGL